MDFLDRRNSVILAFIVLANLLLSYLVIGLGMSFLYVENSWMENIQASVLIISCLLFAFQSFRLTDRHRWVAAFFSSLCFIFAFREVDVDKFDVPAWLIFLLAEKGRAIFFAIAFTFLGLILKDSKYYFKNFALYFKTSLGVYVVIAALCLIFLSSAFDQKIIKVTYRVFFEELSELVAYCLLFAASIDITRTLKSIEAKAVQ